MEKARVITREEFDKVNTITEVIETAERLGFSMFTRLFVDIFKVENSIDMDYEIARDMKKIIDDNLNKGELIDWWGLMQKVTDVLPLPSGRYYKRSGPLEYIKEEDLDISGYKQVLETFIDLNDLWK